jgi:hypothetical protein
VALRGEFTDAVMIRDYDRFASLFTQGGAWRMPARQRGVRRTGGDPRRDRVGAGSLGLLRDNRAPGTIQLEGDTAVGRAYIAEFGRMRMAARI